MENENLEIISENRFFFTQGFSKNSLMFSFESRKCIREILKHDNNFPPGKYRFGEILSQILIEKKNGLASPPCLLGKGKFLTITKLKNDIKSLNNSREMKFLNCEFSAIEPLRRKLLMFKEGDDWIKDFTFKLEKPLGLASLKESSFIFSNYFNVLLKEINFIKAESKNDEISDEVMGKIYELMAEAYPSYMVFNHLLKYVLRKMVHMAMVNVRDISKQKDSRKREWEDYFFKYVNDINDRCQFKSCYGPGFSFPKMLDDALEMIYLENELLDELDKFKNLSNGYDDNECVSNRELDLDRKLLFSMYQNLFDENSLNNIGLGIYHFSTSEYSLDEYIFSSMLYLYSFEYGIFENEIIIWNYKNERNILRNFLSSIQNLKYVTEAFYNNIEKEDIELSSIKFVENLSPPEFFSDKDYNDGYSSILDELKRVVDCRVDSLSMERLLIESEELNNIQQESLEQK